MIAKFYYGKKAIAYEISEIGLKFRGNFAEFYVDLSKNEKSMDMRYKIEYRFSSISGIAFIEENEDIVKLVVDLREPPQFAEKAKGSSANTVPNFFSIQLTYIQTWKKRSDFTPGAQASLYRRHTLTFEKKDIEKPK